MTTAFVLTGGGSLGAVQVGMLRALAERGVEPDLLVGTSAGAMNAVWVAAHGMSEVSLRQLASVWTGLRREEIFPFDVRRAVRGLLGLSNALTSNARLRHLVSVHSGLHDLARARVPVHLVATDALSGHDVLLSTGSVVQAVLASAAVPGVFPPVEREGRHLIDGAVAQRTGVSQAVELGATVVYVLPTGSPCALLSPPRSAVGVALHALTLLIEQRLIHEIADLHGSRASVKVLPPLCPLAISAADFRHAAELIDRGHRATRAWIDGGGTEVARPERFLSLHHHPTGLPDERRAA